MKRVLHGIFMLLLFFITQITFADPPGPPGPGGDPTGTGGVPVGGPVGNGVLILVVLGILYAAYRFYRIRSRKMREELDSR